MQRDTQRDDLHDPERDSPPQKITWTPRTRASCLKIVVASRLSESNTSLRSINLPYDPSRLTTLLEVLVSHPSLEEIHHGYGFSGMNNVKTMLLSSAAKQSPILHASQLRHPGKFGDVQKEIAELQRCY